MSHDDTTEAITPSPRREHGTLVVLTNRGPLRRRDDTWVRSDGGLVTALDPVLRRQRGVWVSATDGRDAPEPPDVGYRQAWVPMPPEIRERFYCGVANGVLWPVLHGFPTLADVGGAPWEAYEAANQAFADTASELVEGGDRAWVHDYHLMLLPLLLRSRRPGLRIGWFCHVPWPDVGHFAVLPWRRQILEGLLGAGLIGFHTASYASHFLDCADLLDGVRVDRERATVETQEGTTRVIVAPIGIPTRAIAELAESSEVRTRELQLRRAVAGRRIILGVDRLDYTKGILERLSAYAQLIETHRDLREETVFVQVVVPSREDVPAYAELKAEIDRLVGHINGALGRAGSVPVHYIYGNLDRIELYAHYRAADVALVTPLRDGMNLVALEYVASRTEGDGALVLSEFAGAAERLADAYIVNPYDIDAVAAQLARALRAHHREQHRRMHALRATVASLDVDRWSRGFLAELDATACAEGESHQAAPAARSRPGRGPAPSSRARATTRRPIGRAIRPRRGGP